MSDDFLTAYERALELVGEGVWTRLSAITQATIINEELRLLDAERVARGWSTTKDEPPRIGPAGGVPGKDNGTPQGAMYS